MASLDTNLNVSPYFDDYDTEKNFYRLLFRPSTAVQARELTQIQSIIQDQIERFGNHIFKDGSIIDGVAITYHSKLPYISLVDQLDANGLNTNSNFLVSGLDSTYLITNSTDSNNAVRGVIKIAKSGLVLTQPNTNRLYIDYIKTGKDASNNDVLEFLPDDKLYIYNSNQGKLSTLDSNNLFDTISTLSTNSTFTSNGNAYGITVSDGIIFQKGVFQSVEKQTITVRDYTTNVAGYVVGFQTVETIIDENIDESLNDNVLGYSNENAPGAHRLKLTPTLVSKLRTEVSNNFFAIAEFDSDEPVEQKTDRDSYNILLDSMARRTREESGDYTINPFLVEVINHSSNSDQMRYQVSPGTSYVRGYRIEKIGSTNLTVPRAKDTEVAQNQIVTANYGNYVICDEFLGAFNIEEMGAVDLYDTAQNAISDGEGISASLSGSKVGEANVRAVVYEEGTKGLPTSKYYVYLFNIRMNSGKSFLNDVKSIYANDATYGKAKADIVLENNKAVIKQSSKNNLLLYTGSEAVRRLTNNTGIGDTSFISQQIVDSTISSNGQIIVNISTSAPGGTERLNSTATTTLTGSSLDNYNIYLTANAYTANLSGTINVQSGVTELTGTSTDFTNELVVGDLVRIYDGSSYYIRSVAAIGNTTNITLDASIAATNTTSNYQKYYVGGTPLPIANVYINTNTQFTAQLGETLDSGSQTVRASYPLNRTVASAITKNIRKNRLVKIDTNTNAGGATGPWNLGLIDVHKIRNVWVDTSGSTYANTNPERKIWFTFDSGQRDGFYDHGTLRIKPRYASNINSSTKILVELDHFEADLTSSVGFFSVESYPIDDVNTSNTSAIQTIEIPSYEGNDLRNYVDFRPLKYNTANSVANTNPANGFITINPAVSNTSFNVPSDGQYLITPDSNLTADLEFYLPRIDYVTLDSSGRFRVQQGKSSLSPKAPFVDGDQSIISEVRVPAYPSATQRQKELYPLANSCKTDSKQTRRYTMKDIGALDERIKRVEYYTVLNALEQQARDLTIPDANGLDRFKNGIFADPFNSHILGNVTDFEYSIAIDPRETVARPKFQKHEVDFTYKSANSSNIQKTGPILTLNYNNETYINQRFATKIRNTTESVWQWNGLLDLYPSYDLFQDETVVPNEPINLDFASSFNEFADIINSFGSIFAFNETPVQTIVQGNQSITTLERTIRDIQVQTSTQEIDFGPYVKDVSLQPYMRSRLVAFVAYNMKPNTRLYAFFDDVNVSEHCAPGVLSGLADFESGLEHRIVNQNGNFNDALISDETGFVCGLFRIPEQTFRNGDRHFQLTNVDDLVVGADAKITLGRATYTSDALSVTKSSQTLNVIQPEFITIDRTETRNRIEEIFTGEDEDEDPIAQSFRIENIPANVTGAFITQVGLYFKSKDPSLGVEVYISEMKAGVPDMSKILGKSHLESSSVNISDDASSETVFILNYPVYMLKDTDYAIVVKPDGNSPEYNIWVGETGGYDIDSGEQVFSNPYSGIMFTSANKRSWTAIQKEDLKFNLYRARFSATSGYASFKNEDDEFLTVDGFTSDNTTLSISVGDVVYAVNSTVDVGNTEDVVAKTLTSNSYPFGVVQYLNEADGIIYLDSSRGGFSNTTDPTIAIYKVSDITNTSLLTVNTIVSHANITIVNDLTYHTVVPKFSTMVPATTTIDYNFKGTSKLDSIDSVFQNMENGTDYQYNDIERHLKSYSNEITDLSGSKSAEFKIDMTTTNDFVSPVINLSKKNSFFVENLINNDSTNEHTRYGNAITKYISKKIVLADGQEAEDLKVLLTAHRPNETNIEVYAKIKNDSDPDNFNDKVWSKLEYADGGNLVYSSPVDTQDYIEYEFVFPSANLVDYGAFSNTGTATYGPISGTVNIDQTDFWANGSGTSFTTDVEVGDTIKFVSGSDEEIRTVTSVANDTFLTVSQQTNITNSAALIYKYNATGNDGIVEYQNPDGSRFIGYKEVALKIVLLSSNPVKVPRLNDVRSISLQI